MTNISPTVAARYAQIVMCTWDMCNADLHCCHPNLDPRIQAWGWQLVGYILGQDDTVLVASRSAKKQFAASKEPKDRVCYGFLARNPAGQYIAVIRGTDGAEEWLDDFDFLQKNPRQPLQGRVDAGFYDIFDSMTYLPAAIATGAGTVPEGVPAASATRLANGIAAVTGGASVTVIGHSLGSAIAAYLTAELVALSGSQVVSACLFACPKPGNAAFSDYFTQLGVRYDVFNYVADLVPLAPPLGYSALANITVLKRGGLDHTVHIAASPACCHHLISYIALLDVATFEQTLALPGTNTEDDNCAQCVTLTPVPVPTSNPVNRMTVGS